MTVTTNASTRSYAASTVARSPASDNGDNGSGDNGSGDNGNNNDNRSDNNNNNDNSSSNNNNSNDNVTNHTTVNTQFQMAITGSGAPIDQVSWWAEGGGSKAGSNNDDLAHVGTLIF